MSGKVKTQICIPDGFANIFLTTSEEAIVKYKVTNYCIRELELNLLWNDPSISIEWFKSKDYPTAFKRTNNSVLDSNAAQKITYIFEILIGEMLLIKFLKTASTSKNKKITILRI